MDRNVVGIRALAAMAAITIAGGAAGSGQIAYGGSASAQVAAVGAGGQVASTPRGASFLSAAPRSTRIADPVAAAPAGWTSVTSPWLGYSVTLPDAWGFVGHVTAADSRTPHDIFAGTLDGAETPATLVVGSCRTADATVVGPGSEVITADGGTFDVTAPQAADPGRVTIVATSVAGDVTWYLTACMADGAASQALFRAMVASFRFPDAGFAAPAADTPAP